MVHGWVKRKLLPGLLATSSLCVPSIAAAQVAAANSGTTVYTNPNGVPVVDIAKPDDAGLSHNQFTTYNVDTRGIVLNNGTTDVVARQSQLAGQVTANLNIGARAAKTILNEVTSNNRSVLAGFTEVLGSKADVIVANPYGITCGGCGFINAPNVTLTTGRPVIGADGQLATLRVTGGDILVNGAGLNGSGQDYIALVARRVRIEAPVTAPSTAQVDLVGGSGEWVVVGRRQNALAGDDPTALYAIDSSAVGGAYAGRIRLIVTEAGAGVNMAGDMAASAGDFTIDAAGKVELAGAISTSARLAATTGAAGGIALNGARLTSGAATELNAAGGTLALSGGTVRAGTTLTVTAASLVDASAASTASDANQRYSVTGTTLSVADAAAITGTGWGSDGAFSIAARTLAADRAVLRAPTLTIRAGGDLGLGSSVLRTVGGLTLAAGGALSSSGAVQSTGGAIGIAVRDLTTSGTISADTGALTLTASGTVANDGTLQARDALTIAGNAAIAQRGSLLSNGGITLTGAALTNAGRIQGADAALTLGSLANSGTIATPGTLALAIATAFANTGLLHADNALALTGIGSSAVVASNGGDGSIEALGALSIGNATLGLTGGRLLGDSVTLDLASLTNGGTIQASGRTLTATVAGTVTNSGSLLAKDALSVTAASLASRGGIAANGGIGLTIGKTLANTGQIVTAANLTIARLANGALAVSTGEGSVLQATGAVTIDAASLTAAGGQITGRTVGLTLGSLDTAATIAAGDTIAANVAGQLVNGGQWSTGGTMRLAAGTFRNTGAIAAGGALMATVGGDADNGGRLQAVAGATITVAGTLANGGVLLTGGAMGVRAATVTNAGTVQAGGGLTLATSSLANSGTLTTSAIAGADGRLSVGSIDNRAGGVIQSAGALGIDGVRTIGNAGVLLVTTDLTVAGSTGGVAVSNASDGVFQAGGTLRVSDGAALQQAGGLLANAIALSFTSALNSGLIQSETDLDLQTAGTLASGGLIHAKRALTLRAGEMTNSGTIQAATGADLGGTTLGNTGTIAVVSGGAATFAFGDASNAGTITSAGDLSVALLTRLANSGGLLARGNLTIAGDGIGNATGATMQAGGALRIAGKGAFDNGGRLLGGAIGVDVASITNGGAVQADGDATLSAGSTLDSGGTIYAAGMLGLTATTLTNRAGGGIQGSAGTTVTAATLTNGGRIVATSATGGAGRFTVGTFANSGAVQSAGTLALAIGSSLDNSGTVLALGSIGIDAVGADAVSLVNRGADASIVAGGALGIGPATGQSRIGLDVQGGKLMAGTLTARTTGFANAGQIQSNGVLALSVAGDARNSGVLLGKTAAAIDTATLVNSGTIQIDGGLTLVAGGLTNSGSLLGSTVAGTDASVTADRFDNLGGGVLYSANALSLAVGATLSNAGRILAQGAMTLSGRTGNALDARNLSGGEIRGGGALTWTAGGGGGVALAQGGTLAGDAITLSLTRFAATGTTQSTGALTLATTGASSNAGLLYAGGALSTTGASFANTGELSAASASLSAAKVTNAGLMTLARDGAGAATIATDALSNVGTLQTTGGLALRIGQSLENHGDLLAGGALGIVATGVATTIANGTDATVATDRAATIQAGGALTIAPAGIAAVTNIGVLTGEGVDLAMGSLGNVGTIQSRGTMTLAASGALSSSGTLYAATTLALRGEAVTNSGGIQGTGGTTIAATRFANTAGKVILAADAGKAGTITAGSVTNAATLQSAGDLIVTATDVANSGRTIAGGALTLAASGGALAVANQGAGALLQAGTTLSIGPATGVGIASLANAAGATVYGRTLTLNLASLSNGGWMQSDGALGLTVTGATTNSGTMLGIGATTLAVAGLVNGGWIEGRGTTQIVVRDTLANSGTLIAGNGAGATGTITADRLNNAGDDAVFYGAGPLTVFAREIATDGALVSGGTLGLYAAAGQTRLTLGVNGGLVRSAGALTLGTGAQAVDFTSAMTANIVSAGSAVISAGTFANAGVFQATGPLTLGAVSLGNDGTILSRDAITATVTNTLTNGGTFQGTLVQLNADTLRNAGTFNVSTQSGNAATLNLRSLVNTGRIQSQGALTLALAKALDNSGQILGGADVTVSRTGTDTFGMRLAAGGVVQSGGTLTMQIDGLALNQQGTLAADTLKLRSASLTNSGTIQSAQGMEVATGTGTLSTSGVVYAGGAATLTAGSIATGTTGGIQAVGGLKATATTINNAGTMVAGRDAATGVAAVTGNAEITATTLVNSGTLRATGKETLAVTGSITNAGLLYAVGDIAVTNGGTGTLSIGNSGTVYAKGDLTIRNSATNLLKFASDAQSGTLRGGTLTIGVDALNNTGTIQGESNGSVTTTGLFTNGDAGIVYLGSTGDKARGTMTFGSLANSGSIQALGTLTLNAGTSITNGSAAQIIAAGNLTLNGTGGATTLVSQGVVQTNGKLTIGAAGNRFAGVTSALTSKILGAATAIHAGTLTLGDGAGITTSGATTIDADQLSMGGQGAYMVLGDGSTVTVNGAFTNPGFIYSPGALTLNATSVTNAKTGGLAAGKLLTVTATGVFDNWGSIYGDDLALTAGTLTNYASSANGMGTIEASRGATLKAGTIVNNYLIQSNGDLTIDADVVRNEVTGGDTRYWNYEGTGFYPYNQDGDQDSRTAAYGGDHDGNGADTRAAYGNSWTITKNDRSTDGTPSDTTINIEATFSTRQLYRGDKPAFKPQMLANGTLTIENFSSAKNLGGTISAHTIDIIGKPGSTLLNDALAVTQQDWKVAYNHYQNCYYDAAAVANRCDAWRDFRSYDKSISSTSTYDAVGASITATVIHTQAKTVNNVASAYIVYKDTAQDTKAAAEAKSKTGATADAAETAQDVSGATGSLTQATGLQIATASNVADVTKSIAGVSAVQASLADAVLTAGSAKTSVGGSRLSSGAVTLNTSLTKGDALNASIGTVTKDSGVVAPIATATGGIATVGQTNTASLATVTVAAPSASPVKAVTASGVTQLTFDGGSVVLPSSPNARFVPAPTPTAIYLIESNPRFSLGTASVSSDFMAQRLGVNVDLLQRRLGDAAYEEFLITQQVVAQTGTAALVRSESSDQQALRLMTQGVAVARDLGLTYGKPLSAAQVGSLKQDLVWMVETEVQGQKVLAPVVYLSSATKSLFDKRDAVIAGDVVTMDVGTLTNTGGTITGSQALNIRATGDITNTSGQIGGGNVSVTSTGGSIVNQTMSFTTGDVQTTTVIGKTAGISATGTLNLDAAKDITTTAATISAAGDASLKAGGDITFGTIDNKTMTRSSSGNAAVKTTTIEQIGSSLNVGGNLKMSSGGDTTLKASQVNVGGNADVATGGSFNILAGQNSKETDSTSIQSGLGVGGGVYGTSTTTTNSFQGRNVASGFNIGGNLNADVTGTMTVQGSNVGVGGDATVKADAVRMLQGNDVNRSTTTTVTTTYLRTASGGSTETDTHKDASASAAGASAQASAGAGASAGATGSGDLELMNNTRATTQEDHTHAVGSTFTVGGNAALTANKDVTLQGSSLTVGGDVDVKATDVNLLAAENRDIVTTTTDSTSVGLMSQSKNTASADAAAGASASLTAQGQAGAGAKAETDNTVDLVRNSKTTTTGLDVTHTGSSITSGGNAAINASSGLTVQGSSIDAGGDVALKAKDMQFQAVNDVHETTTKTEQTGAGLYVNGNTEAKAGAEGNMIGAKAGASVGAEGSAGINVSHTTDSTTEGSTTAVTSSIRSGGNMSRTAGGRISDEGTQIEAGGNFDQTATEWDSKAARDTTYKKTGTSEDTGRIGAYADADAGVSAGAGAGGGTGADAGASAGVKASYDHKDQQGREDTSTARTSTIKAGGNVATTTTGKASLEGTAVNAGGDVSVTAGSLDYKAARNTESSSTSSNEGSASAKVGVDLTKAVKVGVEGSYEGAQETTTSSKAVAGGMTSGGNLTVRTTAGDADFEGTRLNSGGNATIDSAGAVNMTAARDTATKTSDTQNAALGVSTAGKSGGVEASGGFTHEGERSSTAQTGSVDAKGDLTIRAKRDANFEGTDTSAGGATTIGAGGDVNRTAAENTHTTEAYGAQLSGSAEGEAKEKAGDGPKIGTHRDGGGTDAGAGDGWTSARPSSGAAGGGTTIGGNRGTTGTSGGWTSAAPSNGDAGGSGTTIGGGRTTTGNGGSWTSAAPSGSGSGGTTIGDNRGTAGSDTGGGGWKAAKPTQASASTDAGGSLPTTAAPKPGVIPAAPDGQYDKTGGAEGGFSYSSTSETSYKGGTSTSGGGTTITAGGNVTQENSRTDAKGGVTVTAGGTVKDTTKTDTKKTTAVGASLGGQSSSANAAAGNTDAGTGR